MSGATAARGSRAIELSTHVAMVGSGKLGAELSHPSDANVYLVHDGGESVLVDAGCGLGQSDIVRAVADVLGPAAGVRAVLVTHAHADHAAGAAGLAAAFDAPVLCSARVADVLAGRDPEGSGLAGAKRDGLYPDQVRFDPVSATVLADGDETRVGGLVLRAALTEGHADGHLSFLLDAERAVFTGDLVFARGQLALLDGPETRPERLLAALQRLEHAAVDRLYPGHGSAVMRRAQAHLSLAIEPLRRGEAAPSLI